MLHPLDDCINYECWFSWNPCKSIVELPPILACKLQKKLGFSDPKYTVRTVCSIWPWHPHSNLLWDRKRQQALLMTCSALPPPQVSRGKGLCLCSKVSTQVALESFHILQENCWIILLWVSLVPGILPELCSLVISSLPSHCPHTCINNSNYS